jgi:hypothetical protein
VFEKRVLRRIFASKRDELKLEWRKLHKEELNHLYSSPNYYSGDQIEKNEMGRTCSTSEGEDRCIKDFGGETCGLETTWKT